MKHGVVGLTTFAVIAFVLIWVAVTSGVMVCTAVISGKACVRFLGHSI